MLRLGLRHKERRPHTHTHTHTHTRTHTNTTVAVVCASNKRQCVGKKKEGKQMGGGKWYKFCPTTTEKEQEKETIHINTHVNRQHARTVTHTHTHTHTHTRNSQQNNKTQQSTEIKKCALVHAGTEIAYHALTQTYTCTPTGSTHAQREHRHSQLARK